MLFKIIKTVFFSLLVLFFHQLNVFAQDLEDDYFPINLGDQRQFMVD